MHSACQKLTSANKWEYLSYGKIPTQIHKENTKYLFDQHKKEFKKSYRKTGEVKTNKNDERDKNQQPALRMNRNFMDEMV